MALVYNTDYRISERTEYDPEIQTRCRLVRIAYYMTIHTHEFYEFLLVTSGIITHIVNGKTFNLKKGDLVFIRKNDIHGATYLSPDSEHINFSFSQNTLDELASFIGPGFDMNSLLENEYAPVAHLAKQDEANLYSRMSELFVPQNAEFDKQKLKSKSRYLLTYIFMNYFSDIIGPRAKIPFWLEHTYDAMKQPKNFIAGHERMVELSGRSPEHLSRNFKKYYKTTPINYIIELRLNHAASLLSNSTMSVTDICFECGFNSLPWFHEIFAKQYGMTPGKYREKILYDIKPPKT